MFNKDFEEFDEEIFFNLILPPIIFSGGYNMRKAYFFDNFRYISFFGIAGTIVHFMIVSFFLGKITILF